MSNPVHVSSSDIPDEIKVIVTNQYMFQSIKTNLTIVANFTTTVSISSMIEKEDVKKMMMIGEYT